MRARDPAPEPEPAGTFGKTAQIGALPLFIVSDVRLYREGLAGSLSQRATIKILEVAAPTLDTLARIADSEAAAVLLDIGTAGALRFAQELNRTAPRIKIVAFAVNEVDNELLACSEAGIVGYVARDGSIDDLVEALLSAMRGEVVCSPRHAALLVKRLAALREHRAVGETNSVLTSREREIAALVRDGLSNKEIARSLRIGSATVKNHVHSILTKLQAKSRGQAAAALRESNMTAGPPPRSR
jgi:DNA-binding NarL/FixJ family response regulator